MLTIDSDRSRRNGTAVSPLTEAPTADPAPGRAGVIRQRRGLPNGRAVAGGLLVALAAIGGWLLATGGDGEARSYVVATRDLAPGHRLVPGDLATASLDLPPAQAKGLFLDPGPLAGGVTRGPIQQGALVTAADVAAATGESDDDRVTSTRELSMELPAAQALNGQLLPGDRVDVVATDGTRSKVLVQRALVVAVSGGASEGSLVGGSGTVVVTLALTDPTAALATANGAAAAEITLLRSTLANDQLPTSTDLSATALPAAPEQASPERPTPTTSTTATAAPPAAAPAPAAAPSPAAPAAAPTPAPTTVPATPAVGG